jgi:hypothetical protein
VFAVCGACTLRGAVATSSRYRTHSHGTVRGCGCPSRASSPVEMAEPTGQANTEGTSNASAPWQAVQLDTLRAELRAFAAERAWQQYHTPRNLVLALTGCAQAATPHETLDHVVKRS